jgi:hypothetical protein
MGLSIGICAVQAQELSSTSGDESMLSDGDSAKVELSST